MLRSEVEGGQAKRTRLLEMSCRDPSKEVGRNVGVAFMATGMMGGGYFHPCCLNPNTLMPFSHGIP